MKPQEEFISRALDAGLTRTEIAKRLDIAESTLNRKIQRINAKRLAEAIGLDVSQNEARAIKTLTKRGWTIKPPA